MTCEPTVESVAERADRHEFTAAVACRNGAAETVLTGGVEGLVWKADGDQE